MTVDVLGITVLKHSNNTICKDAEELARFLSITQWSLVADSTEEFNFTQLKIVRYFHENGAERSQVINQFEALSDSSGKSESVKIMWNRAKGEWMCGIGGSYNKFVSQIACYEMVAKVLIYPEPKVIDNNRCVIASLDLGDGGKHMLRGDYIAIEVNRSNRQAPSLPK